MNKTPMQMIAMILLIIGAINWGILGVANILGYNNWDLVSFLLDYIHPVATDIVFILVGLAGLYAIAMVAKKCNSSHSSMHG